MVQVVQLHCQHGLEAAASPAGAREHSVAYAEVEGAERSTLGAFSSVLRRGRHRRLSPEAGAPVRGSDGGLRRVQEFGPLWDIRRGRISRRAFAAFCSRQQGPGPSGDGRSSAVHRVPCQAQSQSVLLQTCRECGLQAAVTACSLLWTYSSEADLEAELRLVLAGNLREVRVCCA